MFFFAMPSICVSFFRIHALLENRAEDRRVYLGPVLAGRALVALLIACNKRKFLLSEIDWINRLEHAAVEVWYVFEPSPGRGLRRVHLSKETTKKVVRTLPFLHTIIR